MLTLGLSLQSWMSPNEVSRTKAASRSGGLLCPARPEPGVNRAKEIQADGEALRGLS